MTESSSEERPALPNRPFDTFKIQKEDVQFLLFVMYSCWDVLQAQKSFLPGGTAKSPGLLGAPGAPGRGLGLAALDTVGTISPMSWFGDADSS